MNSEFSSRLFSTFKCLTFEDEADTISPPPPLWHSLFTFVVDEERRSSDWVSTALSTPSGLISLVTLNLLYLPQLRTLSAISTFELEIFVFYFIFNSKPNQ